MPVHADMQSSRRRDVPRHGRGEEAPVPQIRENCVEAMKTVAKTHAADQPGVLIHGSESEEPLHRSQETEERMCDDEEEKPRAEHENCQDEDRGETGQQERMRCCTETE